MERGFERSRVGKVASFYRRILWNAFDRRSRRIFLLVGKHFDHLANISVTGVTIQGYCAFPPLFFIFEESARGRKSVMIDRKKKKKRKGTAWLARWYTTCMMRPTIDRPVRTPPPLKLHVGLDFFAVTPVSPSKTTERIVILADSS